MCIRDSSAQYREISKDTIETGAVNARLGGTPKEEDNRVSHEKILVKSIYTFPDIGVNCSSGCLRDLLPGAYLRVEGRTGPELHRCV